MIYILAIYNYIYMYNMYIYIYIGGQDENTPCLTIHQMVNEDLHFFGGFLCTCHLTRDFLSMSLAVSNNHAYLCALLVLLIIHFTQIVKLL